MLGIATLMYVAIEESAKSVVTVKQLVASGSAKTNIRLGARVADSKISYQTEPSFKLSFKVRDVESGGETINVVYHGIMPDTLKIGRDVILEGYFDGTSFQAKTLLTQCPSKYEAPKPGESY